MSLMPIFKTSPRIHLHDPFTMDIMDPFTMDIMDPFIDFDDIHAITASHMPFQDHKIIPYGGARVEWNETPEAHVLTAELPGLKKEEVKVKVKEGKFLKISGKKEEEREEKCENWHHFEHTEGKFMRVFSLPENCRADHVRSCFENGILTVTIPKRDVKKSHGVQNIEVKG